MVTISHPERQLPSHTQKASVARVDAAPPTAAPDAEMTAVAAVPKPAAPTACNVATILPAATPIAKTRTGWGKNNRTSE